MNTSVKEKTRLSIETPRGPDQPYLHGYNADELKNWSPETDPYAKYFRSHVPIAKRIEPFQPTQAHPNLTSKANVLSLSADYDKEEWFEAYRYNDSFSRNILKFWQYHDIYGSWHGLPVYGSSKEELEHGVINLPNPAYTDAAHRNGVLSLGGWFWPRKIEFADLLEKTPEGRFLVAEKMIEMAEYFGFDGYFINQEATIEEEHAAQLMEMLKIMRERGLYFSWYDSLAPDGKLYYVNGFNDVNAPWVIDKKDGRQPNDSIFMNYAYTPKRLDDAAAYAHELELDPYEALYAGIENDKFRFERGMELEAIFKDNAEKTPRTSLALFGTDMVWNRGPNQFDPNMQPYMEERECAYWSGPNQNPTKSGRVPNSEALSWPGIAHFIPERSVIGSFPFVTRFNNGHGLAFFINGEKASSTQWNNVGVQDLLPTWQWWSELSVGYDYSKAWNGGASLKVSGKLEKNQSNTLRLYKTELLVSEKTELSLTYQIENAAIQAMLIFKDEPESPVFIDLDSKKSTDWQTSQLQLDRFAGRTIAVIGFNFVAASEFTAHLGELKLTDGLFAKPAQPTGFAVEKAYYDEKQASLFLRWDFEKDPNVWHYDVYRLHEGKRAFLGRIYDGVFYVKSLELNGDSQPKLELIAVGKDGQESSAAQLVWKLDEAIEAEYSYGPFPVTAIGFHSDQKLAMEIGWTRYVYAFARPTYATNIALNWSSSDESVATVNQRGMVTATGVGTTIITAQAGEINGEEGKKVEIPVSVTKPIKPIDGIVIKAEKYDDSNGIFNPLTYLNVRDLNFANWVAYHNIDFGKNGVSHLTVHAAVKEAGTKMAIRLGNGEGRLLVEMDLEKKSGLGAPHYHIYQIELPEKLTGVETLHITFTNPSSRSWMIRDNGIVDVDWFQFK
ncbi:endo-beta-N-acetylglucosaminidase [Bacillus niameyensis]|uniref:endo-beta-N-acetylglucosaminidase n=1 Tax=Bacillus niameyensis TaxID=1522308 RepID=UPI000780E93F|nr:Ig-like domain-containing protein [Bacillus niameyensis]